MANTVPPYTTIVCVAGGLVTDVLSLPPSTLVVDYDACDSSDDEEIAEWHDNPIEQLGGWEINPEAQPLTGSPIPDDYSPDDAVGKAVYEYGQRLGHTVTA